VGVSIIKRLIIVSNRLPINIIRKKKSLSFQPSVGGLSTGLSSFYKSYQSIWIGWPGIAKERIKEEEKIEIEEKLSTENCYPVFLSTNDIEEYYFGFCNKTIWPIFHYFPEYTVYDQNGWESYKRVNEYFCDAVINFAKEGNIIWIHDYHLMLLPKLIRDKFPNVTIGFFLHIPFPSFEVFRFLPWRKEILEGLMGADLIGFHTYDYVQHFFESIRRILGYEHIFSQVITETHVVKVDAFPMGIHYERFSNALYNPEVQKEIKKFKGELKNLKVILSIDRLDYTKGIIQRLEAYDLFLQKNPELREKVSLILVAVPSRTKVEFYRLLKKQVDELVGEINGKYGTISWMPIRYLYRSLPFSKLAALYHVSDVAFITPLRDGMNLIAKEFVATKSDGKGVLILSEMAGAAKELGEALIVNPNNKEEVANALKEALVMPEIEKKERNQIMQERLQRYNILRWVNDFIYNLIYIKKIQKELSIKRLTYYMQQKIINDYLKSNNRLILLDYDGTLVPFANAPEKAEPDPELLTLLESLANQPKNEVVIVSGRIKETLEKWFGDLNISLIAEHGAWIKEKGKDWAIIEPLQDDWKQEIKPILEFYVDKTPGSFIEEKEFSIVWHYRKADSELAMARGRELKNILLHLTANLNLGILLGSKVIEIKNLGINKGRAVSILVSKRVWDFILSIGDDVTDEDIFAVLPETAYSIKVGLSHTKAKFNIESEYKVRQLLKELIDQKNKKIS